MPQTSNSSNVIADHTDDIISSDKVQTMFSPHVLQGNESQLPKVVTVRRKCLHIRTLLAS